METENGTGLNRARIKEDRVIYFASQKLMKIDYADFELIKKAVETGASPEFWHSRTPEERLIGMELMRRKKYGYDEHSMSRMERVIEFIDHKRYHPRPTDQDNPPQKS